MDDTKDYLWLVKTNKGDFFISVLGDWTQEEAAKKVREVFDSLQLEIIGMLPRKRASGSMDTMCTIYQDKQLGAGFSFLAGKTLWVVCGRGSEYEAELIRTRAEIDQEEEKEG